MLKNFKVKNFKNFKDEIVVDFGNVNNYEFNSRAIKNDILKDVIIYGKNSVGKSNLGLAIFDIILHLTDKNKKDESYDLYKCLDEDPDVDTEFEYEFAFDEGSLKYSYKKSDYQTVIYEKVEINGQVVIESSKDAGYAKLEGAETLNMNLYDGNISFVKYIYSNTNLPDNNINNTFKHFMVFVNKMLWFSSQESNSYQGFTVGAESLSNGIIQMGKLAEYQQFLADLGINYDLFEANQDGKKQIYCNFKHGSANIFNVLSKGTKDLTLFFYWYNRLNEASFVFIDEFDAFYHDDLSEKVVNLLFDLENVQCVLTTHNTDIMNNDILRPDCYLQLASGKISSFSNLTQKELRKAHNLQKMYLAGAFDE